MKFIGKLFANAFAVLITAWLLPGVEVKDYLTSLLVAVILSLLNTFIKPLLIILTIPITILSLGLFLIVINVGIILIADYLIDGFAINGFWWALLFSLVMSLINSFFNSFDKKESPNRRKYD